MFAWGFLLHAKKYHQAIAAYEKAVALWGVDADYAAYQIALAYQQLEKYDRVVESLLSFYEQCNSTYRDDAWYRMGRPILTRCIRKSLDGV